MRLHKKAPDPTPERKHMMTSEFNAVDYITDLQATGVPKDQATVHANVLTRLVADLAFSRDLVKLESNLRKEIRECEERMILRIDKLSAEIRAEIAAVRAEFAVLRAEVGSIRNELVLHRWVLGLVLAFCTANLALTVKLVLP
jgi:hypothetical protein